MNKNTIYCVTMDQFLDVIAGLIKRGIVFTAEADSPTKLSITCTGGF